MCIDEAITPLESAIGLMDKGFNIHVCSFVQLVDIEFFQFDFFQMYSFKKNLKENIEIISSQIADLDEDIHILEDLIEKKKD